MPGQTNPGLTFRVHLEHHIADTEEQLPGVELRPAGDLTPKLVQSLYLVPKFPHRKGLRLMPAYLALALIRTLIPSLALPSGELVIGAYGAVL